MVDALCQKWPSGHIQTYGTQRLDSIPPTTQHQYLRWQQYVCFCPLPSQQLDNARPIPPTTNFCPLLSRIIKWCEGVWAHIFYTFTPVNVHVDRVMVIDPTWLLYSSHSGLLLVFFPTSSSSKTVFVVPSLMSLLQLLAVLWLPKVLTYSHFHSTTRYVPTCLMAIQLNFVYCAIASHAKRARNFCWMPTC